MTKKTPLKRLTELSLLTAAALIIFIVELRFPDIIPVPGVKLGLANVITVFVLYEYRCSEAVLVVLARIILGALFASNFSAIIYSLSGAFLCMAGMLPLRRIIPVKYMCLCSSLGAVLHNAGQLIAAALIMRSAAVFVYTPILIISGLIAGTFTGICAGLVIKRISETEE